MFKEEDKNKVRVDKYMAGSVVANLQEVSAR